MGVWIAVGASMVVMLVIMFIAVALGRRVSAAFETACAELGLSYEAPDNEADWHRWVFQRGRGEIDGVMVTVERWASKSEDESGYTEVRVAPRRGLAKDLKLGLETPRQKLDRLKGEGDIEVGDPAFDKVFRIDGLSRSLLAFLDADRRRVLLDERPARCDVLLEDGEVKIKVPISAKPAGWVEMIRGAVAFGADLSLPRGEVAQGIVDNAANDPLPAVRLTCVRHIVAHGHPWKKSALTAALDDVDPRVACAAAIGLGETAKLQELAEGGGLPVETAREVVAALARAKDVAHAPALVALLAVGDTQTRIEAARALGHVGDLSTVEALHVLTRRDGGAADDARDAIARIQARHVTDRSGTGGLSVAAPDLTGGLSEHREQGALSEVDE